MLYRSATFDMILYVGKDATQVMLSGASADKYLINNKLSALTQVLVLEKI